MNPVCESIFDTVDAVVERMLSEAQLTGPPVDAFAVARRLGLEVVLDAQQANRGRHKRIAGRPLLVLRTDERPERVQWAAAHELGELTAWQVFQQVDICGDHPPPELREQTANLLASRLLLPTGWFAEDVRRLDDSVPRLKELYRTASHELIALRLLDLAEPAVVSIFDHGRLTRRRTSSSDAGGSLSAVECRVWQEVHRTGRAAACTANDVVVRGWPIHEPQWKREILLARPTI